MYQGCIDEDDNQLNEGTDALMRAANADPPDPEAHLELSWVLALRGLEGMALPYAQRATELLPELRDSWVFRANAHMSLGQRNEAVDCLRRACSLPDHLPSDADRLASLERGEEEVGPRPVVAFSAGGLIEPGESGLDPEQLKLALFYTRQLLERYPEDPDLLYSSAHLRYLQGNLDQAEPFLVRLLHHDESRADAWTLRALICQKTDRAEESKNFYAKALEQDPDHVLANGNLAKHLLDEGRVIDARVLLERALAADPDDAIANDLYGNTLAYLEGDFEREAEFHERAIRQDPSRPLFRANYCMALLQAGQFQRLDRAWRKHGHLIQKSEECKVPALILRSALRPPKDFGACIELAEAILPGAGGLAISRMLERAWKLRDTLPSDVQVPGLATLAMLAGNAGDHDLSLKAFSLVEKLEGEGAEASLNVARVFGYLGRCEEAIAKASAVWEATPRRSTILADLQREAGDLKGALANYREAVASDPEFSLPVCNGIRTSLGLLDWSSLDHFTRLAEERFPESVEVIGLVAEADLARGFPAKAADRLTAILAPKGEFLGVAELDSVDEESGEDSDLSVSSNFETWRIYYLFGVALLRSREFARLSALANWLQQELPNNGYWSVLSAEALRLQGAIEPALAFASTVRDQPPPLVTVALCHLARGEVEEAGDAIAAATAPQFDDKTFEHPQGNPRAVAEVVRAVLRSLEGNPEDAIAAARAAVSLDERCPMAHLALVEALERTGQIDLARQAAQDGLNNSPGDPGLVEWLVNTLIEGGDPKAADAVLGTCRDNLSAHGQKALAHELGEAIARAQLDSGRSDSSSALLPSLDWPWLERVDPRTKQWIEAAVAGDRQASWLRLSLAVYLCKSAELELYEALALPFKEHLGSYANRLEDEDLREFSAFLRTGRSPGLGGMHRALSAAARGSSGRRSDLADAFRSFLETTKGSGGEVLMDREFLDRLRLVARVRNQIAHLGELPSDDFDRIRDFLIDAEGPGPFFRALGVADVS